MPYSLTFPTGSSLDDEHKDFSNEGFIKARNRLITTRRMSLNCFRDYHSRLGKVILDCFGKDTENYTLSDVSNLAISYLIMPDI